MSETTDLSSPAAASQQKSGSMATERSYRGSGADDLLDAGAGTYQGPGVASAAQPRGAVSTLRVGQAAFAEVEGDPVIKLPTIKGAESAAGAHEEVGVDAAESGEEYIQATQAELSAAVAESGEESAFSDLRGIEGYVDPAPAGEGALINDAGSAAAGAQQEFLPILGALVPTLVSTVGPMFARAVAGKLSSRAQTVIRQIASRPRRPVPVGPAAKAAGNAATGVSSLLPLLATLLQTALNKGGGESAEAEGAVDEALVTEAAAAMEVIIGIDQRLPITNTNDIPWRRICALRIQFPSGATYRGTGFFIGPRAIATAGHCVYMRSQGGWARKIEVMPGCNGSKRPFGQVEATVFRSVGGWVNNGLPECDYGCIFVPPGSFGGHNLGSFGVASFDAQSLVAQPAVVAGYPGDKPFAELWGMAEVIKAVGSKTLVYNVDTVGGQSGAPVYIKRAGVRYVVGIHNYGASSGNSATRITKPVYERLVAWKNM
ncbi:Peptidase S1 and S6 chymotrypsin/Hap (modular protein) [Cupriavidus necator]|uniref:Serine protease n=1 Tax=Cupriavidus necator TaxID=106590 RepID=A0A1K0JI50_CUPNE|nr:Peptidase S1 and S6 chymotrypsin/Hap (modular protein) [Cupriavidus necator]